MENGKYNTFHCQLCGEWIGFTGRFFHKCKEEELKYGWNTTCIKCRKYFNMLESVDGFFAQYVIFKCPGCEQMYTKEYYGTWLPNYVVNDDSIIKIKGNE